MPQTLTLFCLVGYAIASSVILDFTSDHGFLATFAQLAGAAVLGAGCARIEINKEGGQ